VNISKGQHVIIHQLVNLSSYMLVMYTCDDVHVYLTWTFRRFLLYRLKNNNTTSLVCY